MYRNDPMGFLLYFVNVVSYIDFWILKFHLVPLLFYVYISGFDFLVILFGTSVSTFIRDINLFVS